MCAYVIIIIIIIILFFCFVDFCIRLFFVVIESEV